jgi:AraC-like DNA-binding protein
VLVKRRLKDEVSGLRRTPEAVRSSLALHYLQHSSMSGAEISFLLGFEDPNSFVCAFQEWSGTTPRPPGLRAPIAE